MRFYLKSKISLLFLILFCCSKTFANVPIKEIVKSALQNNEQLFIAKQNLNASKSKMIQCFSQYLPNLSLQASYAKNYNSPVISEFSIGGITTETYFGFNSQADLKSWQVTLSQNIFSFGRIESLILNSIENMKNAELDIKKIEQDIVFNSLSSYFQLVADKISLDYANQNYEIAKLSLEKTKIMYKNGMASDLDKNEAESSFLSAKQSIEKANDSLGLSLLTFRNVTGIDQVDFSSLDFIEKDEENFVENRRFEEITNEAYENNPDYQKALINVNIAQNNLLFAKSNLFPSIVGQGNYSWSNSSYQTNPINFDQTNWSVVLSANWNLFDGLNTQAKINEANHLLDTAKANLVLAKKTLDFEIKKSYFNHVSARKSAEIAKNVLASRQKSFEIAKVKYKKNAMSIIDFMDIQSKLSKAQQDYILSKLNLYISYLQLKKTVGTLNIEEFGI